jgi:hypothetical protein
MIFEKLSTYYTQSKQFFAYLDGEKTIKIALFYGR